MRLKIDFEFKVVRNEATEGKPGAALGTKAQAKPAKPRRRAGDSRVLNPAGEQVVVEDAWAQHLEAMAPGNWPEDSAGTSTAARPAFPVILLAEGRGAMLAMLPPRMEPAPVVAEEPWRVGAKMEMSEPAAIAATEAEVVAESVEASASPTPEEVASELTAEGVAVAAMAAAQPGPAAAAAAWAAEQAERERVARPGLLERWKARMRRRMETPPRQQTRRGKSQPGALRAGFELPKQANQSEVFTPTMVAPTGKPLYSAWTRTSQDKRRQTREAEEAAAASESADGTQERRQRGQGAQVRRMLKAVLHQRVLQEMAVSGSITREEAHTKVLALVEAELAQQPGLLRRGNEREELIESLLNDVFGLGPIQILVDDPGVEEIMVNGPDEVFVERSGRVHLTGIHFDSEEHEMSVIERIVGMVGRRVDESFPMADARLPDGSRVNVILPPLALHGPCLTIRKFREEHYTGGQLVEMGSANADILGFLAAAVKGKENILIAGGTSSGKTTLLNVISSYIGDDERIVTIEDAAELRLEQRHVVPLETRPPNSEGKGTIVIRDLVRNSLRMRPDRIIVGEVRGPEALDMIQAMNTGHDGSMSTLHANSSEDALHRLEAMAMMAGVDVPSESIRFQICSAISLVVYTERVSGGARKIVDVSEVVGGRGEMSTRSLFRYQQSSIDNMGNALGRHVATGVVPVALARIRERGGAVSEGIFAAPTERRRQPRGAAAAVRVAGA